jgi:hypothetical protein
VGCLLDRGLVDVQTIVDGDLVKLTTGIPGCLAAALLGPESPSCRQRRRRIGYAKAPWIFPRKSESIDSTPTVLG